VSSDKAAFLNSLSIRSGVVLFYDRTLLGYHGCDQATADQLLSGVAFLPSTNQYDWLGKGVYFWEYGVHRALRFAKEALLRKGISTPPAVVGAVLQLGKCFDLLDTRFTQDLAQGFVRYKRFMRTRGALLPKNRGKLPDKKLRLLDCSVLNWYLAELDSGGLRYDTVRGSFLEGGPAFSGSKISKEAHIQIAVRNPACILGVFRPTRTP
jgi:hypothetical protein